MIDPSGFISLVYEVYKDIKEPKIAHVSPLNAIEEEPRYIDLKSEGHEFAWAKEAKVRKLIREGWKPVVERNKLRSTIFMDQNEELLLMYK